MTGFEIAGAVLGTFPLLIEGLKFYIAEAGTVRTLWRPKRALHRLAVQVRMESAYLQNTIENLLQDLVDESQLSELRDGRGWDDDLVKEKLQKRLGKPYLVDSFVEVMSFMDEDLKLVIRKLQLEAGRMDAENTVSRDRWTELKAVLSMDDLHKTLADIDKHNRDLDGLAKSLTRNQHTPLNTNAAKHYASVRTHAINLYRVFRRKLSAPDCTCSTPHFAGLQLEARSIKGPSKAIPTSTSLRFRVLFNLDYQPSPWNATQSYTYAWLGMEFEPVELDLAQEPTTIQKDVIDSRHQPTAQPSLRRKFAEKGRKVLQDLTRSKRKSIETQKPQAKTVTSEPPPTGVVTFDLPTKDKAKTGTFSLPAGVDRIENVCALIQQGYDKVSSSCIGILVDERDGTYRIWPTEIALTQSCLRGTVLLEHLVKRNRIPKRYRLALGVQLASTVFQLYQTEWLGEVWGKRDIVFLTEKMERQVEGGGYVSTVEPVLSKPMCMSTFQLTNYNTTIYSLGVVLAELALESKLEELNENGEISNAHMTQICKEMGAEYVTVVGHCLWGLSTGSPSLDDKAFKNKFYEKVIAPLESNFASTREIERWDEI
ncbi:hypothetical protein K440DRAFT_662727 [Wilcoxina mikolae CBS 423.85]|nr:hypothetical protein K440DRAFT_662727 [Wilcoxina mikolae CBS 423.85]